MKTNSVGKKTNGILSLFIIDFTIFIGICVFGLCAAVMLSPPTVGFDIKDDQLLFVLVGLYKNGTSLSQLGIAVICLVPVTIIALLSSIIINFRFDNHNFRFKYLKSALVKNGRVDLYNLTHLLLVFALCLSMLVMLIVGLVSPIVDTNNVDPSVVPQYIAINNLWYLNMIGYSQNNGVVFLYTPSIYQWFLIAFISLLGWFIVVASIIFIEKHLGRYSFHSARHYKHSIQYAKEHNLGENYEKN